MTRVSEPAKIAACGLLWKNKQYKLCFTRGNTIFKKVFKTNWNETRIIEPLELQDFLDKQPGFAFVRPSGTEDVIRIHIEADNNEKVEKIKEILLKLTETMNAIQLWSSYIEGLNNNEQKEIDLEKLSLHIKK